MKGRWWFDLNDDGRPRCWHEPLAFVMLLVPAIVPGLLLHAALGVRRVVRALRKVWR